MKRKSSAHMAASEEEGLPVKKIAVTASEAKKCSTLVENDDTIDVQSFLLRDCQESSKQLVAQAKKRALELQQQLEIGKKRLLDAFDAEKENFRDDGEAYPQAYVVSVRCVTGPYHEMNFSMEINVKRCSSCFIGRSTGRKFRPPRGLSMPKDLELSTSHAQIKMETTGKLFFIDLDSTNGTRIDGVELEPNEPFELDASKPIKVEIGAGEFEFMFEQKA
ncbi:SMAD/FHA domain [Plasmopara halstedii]|uniref:SMAD/FHA domain n=1 Tax=Plasmopara halstedii TaxID=4781 RepID=A0A0P1B088_PLAHL|nr:SMAD/FHA domain [Plasmopara halstedii]CEG48152.1 SMAD/FHA domain [Plasmopara halstedii]|eukprot:XP_024584521.1 SMAD/FHA domain [Plasmopara halstedii]